MNEDPEGLESELPTFTEYAVLMVIPNMGEAYVIQQVLTGNGIPARIENEMLLNNAMGGIGMPIDGIQLSVPSTMLSEAARIISETRPSPPQTEQPTEQQRKVRKRFELFVFMLIVSIPLPLCLPVAFVLGLTIWSHGGTKLLGPWQKLVFAIGMTIVLVMILGGAILIVRYFLYS